MGESDMTEPHELVEVTNDEVSIDNPAGRLYHFMRRMAGDRSGTRVSIIALPRPRVSMSMTGLRYSEALLLCGRFTMNLSQWFFQIIPTLHLVLR